jgi:large subunit ribosomal protein L22
VPKRFSYENTGLVRAQARWVRSSPQKARVVLAHIRGKSVLDARAILLYSKRDVAKDIELVLRSAVANAEANHGLSPDELVVHEAFADDGVTIKRWRPRARGRATRIEKRTTHITLLLRAVEGLAVEPEPEPEPEPEQKPKRRRSKAAAAEEASASETAGPEAAADDETPASTDEPAEGATEPGEGEDAGPVSTDAPAEGPDDESADPEASAAADDENEDDEAAAPAADDEKGKD